MKFLIAHVVTGEAGERIDALRRDVAERFHVQGALRLPPHITLVTPFEHADGAMVFDAVRDAIGPFLPFTIKVKGFSSFGKRVWFIDVEQDQKLPDLKRAIQSELGPQTGWLPGVYDKEAHFHLTIAYKDVMPETHEAIGEYLKTVALRVDELVIDTVTVLTHEDRHWTPYEHLPVSA